MAGQVTLVTAPAATVRKHSEERAVAGWIDAEKQRIAFRYGFRIKCGMTTSPCQLVAMRVGDG